MPTTEADDREAPADLVLRGGVVHAMTAAPGATAPGATAIAVRGGRVARVGDDREVLPLAGPSTRVLDLDGRAVLPGINDGHLHGAWLGALWPDTLFGADGVPGPGPQRPLRDAAARRRAILRTGELLASLGITSYTEPGLGPGEDGGATGAFDRTVLAQYRALAAEGLLRARVTVLSLYGELDGPSDLAAFLAGLAADAADLAVAEDSADLAVAEGTAGPAGDGGAAPGPAIDPRRLRVIGVKIFADGIPPMRSAYTHRCYAGGGRAALLVGGGDDADREANLTRMILAAHRAGLQVGVHATGDRAIDVVLDAVACARAERDVDLAHYVIHGDLASPAQLRRMAALDVGLSAQPGIALCTRSLVDQALGPGTAAAAWPLRAALDAGIPLCLSSDAPVLSPDWRRQVAAADEWMGPAADRRARMEALLRCYTVHPARQDRAATWKGTLAPGMAADLCVLAADPFGLSPAELPDLEVDLTVLAGEVVHERRVRSIA